MRSELENNYFKLLGDEELYNRLNNTFDPKVALEGIEYYKKLDEEFGHKYPDSRYQEFYNSLIEQNKHSDLEKWLEEIKERAEVQYQSKINTNIIIKFFPSGSLNAQIRAYEEGYLILINECIRELFFDLYGIMMRYDFFQESVLVDKQRETYSKDEFIDKWSTVLSSYVQTGTYSSNFHDYIIAGNHNSLFQGFVSETEYFIIAHEYAHALLNHITSPKNLFSYHSPVGNIEVNKKNWAEEFEADVLGIGTILERKPTVFNMIAITSSITFFLVDDLLTQINRFIQHNNIRLPILTDHPPAKERIMMISNFIKSHNLLDNKYYKIINAVKNIIEDCGEHIVNKVIGNIKTSNNK